MSSASDHQKQDALEAQARLLDGAEPALDTAELDAMFAEVEQRSRRNDQGLLGWLRSRPTWLRRTLMLATLGGFVALLLGRGVRSNLDALPPSYLWAGVLGLTAGVLVSSLLALRPLHRPALRRGVDWAVAGAALGVTLGVAALSPSVAAALAPDLLAGAAHCTLMGVAMALPVLLVGRLLDRGSLSGPLMSATAAGLAANLILMLRCPVTEPAHCITGHFSVAVLMVGLMMGLRRLA